MSESAGATAGQPASAASQPVVTQQSTQNVLSQQQIDPQQYEVLRRKAEQADGMRSYYDTGRKYGFDRPEKLEEFGQLAKTLQERGLSPKQVAAAFAPEVAAQSANPENLTKEQIEEMIGQRVTKAQADLIRSQAQAEHDRHLSSEWDELEDVGKIKSLLGEGFDDKAAEFAKYAALGLHMSQRKPYGDDHPLKGTFGYAGPQGMESIRNQLKEYATALKAQQALSIGAAARKTPASSTPAGNGAGQGKPDARKPGQLPSRADIEAALEARQAARR